MRTDADRAIALAGVFQSAYLAQQVARDGRIDEDVFESSLKSILNTDPLNVIDVYGGPEGLRVGLETLVRQMDRPGERDIEVTRHAVSLLQLAHRLVRHADRMQAISDGIDSVKQNLEHFPLTHENQVAALADLYHRNISTLKPRIMVRGEPLHLQNPTNQNRIRASLLAGIRAGILWVQCDGSRWRLLFGRHKLAAAARHLASGTD